MKSDKLLLRSLVFACMLVLIFFLVQPIKYLMAAFVIDDGLYYLEVARNIVLGNGVTYDNRTYTNGFHPLWGAISVLIALAGGTESSSLLRFAMIIQSLFVIVGLLCLWQIAKEIKIDKIGTVCAIILLFFLRLDLWLSTMESCTQMLLLLILVMVSLQQDLVCSIEKKKNVLLGILLALCFLARLDTIFIVISFLFVQTLTKIKKKFSFSSLTPPLITGTVFTLVSAPYLIANMIFFGSIMPVSGLKKTGRTGTLLTNAYSFFSNLLNCFAQKFNLPASALYVIALGGLAVLAWLCLHPRSRPGLACAFKRGILPAFALGIIVRGLYLLLFVEEYTKVPWYWVPEYVACVILSGIIISQFNHILQRKLFQKAFMLYGVVAVVFATGCAYLIYDAQIFENTNGIAYDTAAWASHNLPHDKLFAMYDSGVFAFFSNHDVIPLNGLITDRKTMEKLRSRRTGEVMRDFDVDYYVRYVDETIALPPHIVVYQSEKVPNGIFRNNKLTILNFKAYPQETINYVEHNSKP